MEIRINNARPRQTEKTAGAASRAEAKKAGAAFRRSRADKQEWSQQALAFLQEVNRQDMEKQRKLLEVRQKGNSELDAVTKALKTMDKCRKIASRIMKGDKVPPQDEQYLMDNDPDGYKLALVCREPKEKPKKWESVLEDEDLEGGQSGGEAAEAGDSGGEAASEC